MNAVRLMLLATRVFAATMTLLLMPTALQSQAISEGAPVGAPFVATVRTLSGDSVRIGQGTATTIVAVFATWCIPCRDEVPALNMLQRDFASRGVRVIALSMDAGSNEHLSGWLRHYGAKYPVTRDSTNLARLLGVTGVPAVYVVNNDGRVHWMLRGALLSSLPELRARLKQLPEAAGNKNR